MRWLALTVAFTACSSSPLAAAPGTSAAVHALHEEARFAQLAAPIAFAPGGRWIGGDDHDLVVFAGAREVQRIPAAAAKPLLALPGGRWAAGARLLDRAGEVLFDGYSWSHRYGRFGSPSAVAFSPDGSTAILAPRDGHSICDCDRGHDGSTRGALVRLTFGEGPPVERELMPFDGTRFAVAASARAIAAIEATTLRVWSARGDDPPVVAALEAHGDFTRLVWVGERYLVGERWADVEHSELVVFDRDAGFAATGHVLVAGTIQALAVRPGPTAEVAVATSRYRAHTTVEIDEKAVQVLALDGEVHARAALDGYPIGLAWDAAGTHLMVAVSTPTPAVIRFATR